MLQHAPAGGAKGNILQGQYIQKNGADRIFTKTAYDPTIYSDDAMEGLGMRAFKDAMDNNNFNTFDRSFIGNANGRTIAGHYVEINGEKVIKTWWIDK